MTDVTLGVPLGPFFWRAAVKGDLCYCSVEWDCQYNSAESIAIPPTLYRVGNDLIVTNTVVDCENRSEYVSPGVLTLTPTVTCPSYDPQNPDDIVTELQPVYLTITEGTCYGAECDWPVNAGFETGDASGWSSVEGQIETGTVFGGNYAWRSIATGLTLEQTYFVQGILATTAVTWSCKAHLLVVPSATLTMEMFWYDSQGSLLGSMSDPWVLANGVWSSPYVAGDIPVNAATILCRASSPDEHVIVDEFSLSPCV